MEDWNKTSQCHKKQTNKKQCAFKGQIWFDSETSDGNKTSD